jgi:AcrR family transcriptional regulator
VPPRRQRLPRSTRRQQLLDVALARFGAQGYHDTSMEEIAEEAGVTKPVVYQHFASKTELYLELLAAVGEEVIDAITDVAGREHDPQSRVQAGFETYFRWVRENTSAFRLLFGGSSRQEDGSAEVVRAIEDRMASVVGAFIEAGVEPAHQDLLGYAIVGLGEITARQWVARGEPLDPDEGQLLAERLAGLVWAGLRSLPGVDEARTPRARAR